MDQDIERHTDIVAAYATGTGTLAAIAFWIPGRWLAGGMLQAALGRKKLDSTLMRCSGRFVAVALNIVLVVAILGCFGVQTTTFAAIGIGIGGAMQPWRDKRRAIPNVLAEAGFPVPMPAQLMLTHTA